MSDIVQKNKIDIFCINLDRCPENFKKIEDEFGDLFNIIRVPAIDGKINKISGVKALFRTNINLFNNIINNEQKYKYLIVIEDDIYKYNDFDLQWPKINEFINNYTDWDFISLDFFLNFEKPKLEIYNDIFYKITASRMTGFMIYNINFLKKNIKYLESLRMECLDVTMKFNKNFIQLIPKKLLIKQICDKISSTAMKNQNELYSSAYNSTEDYLLKR